MQTTMQFAAAKAARDKGHAAGDAAARKAGSEWVEDTLSTLALKVRFYDHDTEFTMEEARNTLGSFLPVHDRRAWGPVTRQAVARGIIVRTGGYRAAVSSNGSPKPLYRKA